MPNNSLNYQGPSLNYKSYIDGPTHSSKPSISKYGKGYANIEHLREELEKLAYEAMGLYKDAESEMIGYTLTLDTSDETLINSHKMNYPEDDTPNSISFKEYIYNFTQSKTTSSKYVNRFYENKVRGIYGTNALDIAHIARITYSEVKRIENFLENYIGEIDDDKELRILESFQDWTQNAKDLLPKFRKAFSTKRVKQIPQQEMAELTEARAKEFQGLFQSKLNILNSSISDQVSQTYKDWDLVSDIFYDKILGPSLRFNLNVTRDLSGKVKRDKAPILHAEAVGTSAGLENQLQVSMGDQVKRNNLFYDYLARILLNIEQRDTYVNYLDQLSGIGTVLPNPFITQLDTEPTTIESGSSLLGERRPVYYDDNASSDHSFLTGTDADDAHPQYVKKTGDIIEGNLEIFGGLRLDGKQIEDLFGYDEDGNVTLKAGYIDWKSLGPEDTSDAVNEFTPDNLEVSNRRVLSDGKIEYTINFEIENANVQGYEIEVIEL